jgi:hypothetical protein
MSFGAGFNQGSAAVARGLAARAQQQQLEQRQQQVVQQQQMDLVKFLADNPNVKGDVIARLGPFSSIPPDKVQESIELAKVLQNAEKRRESGEASAAAFTSLSTDPRTGLPGPAATLGAQAAQTPALRGDFSKIVEGIQQLPPEQRVRETNRLASAIQAVPGAQQGVALQRGFESSVAQQELREELGTRQEFQIAAEEREERRLRERPGPAFRRVDQLRALNQQDPTRGLTQEAADAHKRQIVKLDAYGAAAVAEATRQGFELSSAEQQTMGTVGDLAVAEEMLNLALSIPPEKLRKFTGVSGRAFRLVSGVTAGVVDFTEAFGEDKGRVDSWIEEQFALGLSEFEPGVGEDVQERIRFLQDREMLGTFDAYILASQIALARSNTRGGRVTRVALDQAKEQLDPNRFSDSDAVLGAFRGARTAMKTRGRVLERQMRATQGARISPILQGVRDSAKQINENPGALPTTLSPERERELNQELATDIQRETEKSLSGEGKGFLKQFDKSPAGQQEAPQSAPQPGRFNVNAQTVRSALTAVGVPEGRNLTDAEEQMLARARKAAADRFQQNPEQASNHELTLLLTMPRLAGRAEQEIRRRGGTVEDL